MARPHAPPAACRLFVSDSRENSATRSHPRRHSTKASSSWSGEKVPYDRTASAESDMRSWDAAAAPSGPAGVVLESVLSEGCVVRSKWKGKAKEKAAWAACGCVGAGEGGVVTLRLSW